MPVALTVPRSARLALWANAWLAGEVALADAALRIEEGDEHHTVAGLAVDDLPLETGLARLRAAGVVRLRVVLPVPGDVIGLPASSRVTPAALAAGEVALAARADGGGLAVVPAVTAHGTVVDGHVTSTRWEVTEAGQLAAEPGPFLAEAEQALREGVVECARDLADLDVARWRPELTDALADARALGRVAADEGLPRGLPARAVDLLRRTASLRSVLDLATVDHGGAADTRETVAREQVLRELSRLVRQAAVAAYNSYGRDR